MSKKKDSLPDGRKYRLAIICLLVLLGGFGLAAINPVFASLYNELATGVLAVLFVYCGGNVGKSWVITRQNGSKVEVNSANSNDGNEVDGTDTE